MLQKTAGRADSRLWTAPRAPRQHLPLRAGERGGARPLPLCSCMALELCVRAHARACVGPPRRGWRLQLARVSARVCRPCRSAIPAARTRRARARQAEEQGARLWAAGGRFLRCEPVPCNAQGRLLTADACDVVRLADVCARIGEREAPSDQERQAGRDGVVLGDHASFQGFGLPKSRGHRTPDDRAETPALAAWGGSGRHNSNENCYCANYHCCYYYYYYYYLLLLLLLSLLLLLLLLSLLLSLSLLWPRSPGQAAPGQLRGPPARARRGGPGDLSGVCSL